MSVINQMLRDLDDRAARNGPKAFADRLRLQPSAKVSKWRTVAASCVVVGGALYVGVALNDLWDRQEARSATPPAGNAPAAASPVAPGIATPSVAVTPPPTTTTAVVPSSDEPPPATRDDSIVLKSVDARPLPSMADGPGRHKASAPDMASPVIPAKVAVAPPSGPAPPRSPAPADAPPPALPVPVDPAREPEQRASTAMRSDSPRSPARPPAPTTSGPTQIDKTFTSGNGVRSAEGEYRQAAQFIGQGRLVEAQAALRGVLDLDPAHEPARQALAALLIDARSLDVAQAVLGEGLQRNPGQVNFALAIARLRFEHGDVAGALALLRDHARYASGHPEYRAFQAALLARQRMHEDAAIEYEAALRIAPGIGAWWLGLAMSREALGQSDAAIDAFRRARLTRTLTANLEDLVERRLRGVP